MSSAVKVGLVCACLAAFQNGGNAVSQGNLVRNGGLEETVSDGFPHWIASGKVAAETVSGVWRRLSCKFRSGTHDKVGFSFEVPQGASGSVWVDNIVLSSGLRLQNPGFEEWDDRGGPAGWTVSNHKVTIFPDATRVSEGKRSLRLTHEHEAVPMTLLWQRLAVEPNHEYTLSFDIFVGDDFQGEMKGWFWEPTLHHSLDFDYANLLTSSLVEERDRLGRTVATLRPATGAPAGLSQVVAVPPGANLQAGVDYDNSAFKGVMRFSLEDVASGQVLRQWGVADSHPKWQRHRVAFQSVSAQLRVRVSAEGEGILRVDNVAVTYPEIVPPLQQVRWLPAARNYRLPSRLLVSVKGPAGKVIETGLALLSNDCQPHGTTVEKTTSAQAPVRVLIGAQYAVKGRGSEAYGLTVGPQGVTIRAGQEAGAFYGLMTLLQLLEARDGKPVLLACEVTDYPDMPMRGILYGDAEQAARWKMNTFMVSTGCPVAPPEIRELRTLVDQWHSLNLQVIPYFLTLFGGYCVQKQNPNLAAGVWVKGEKLVLLGAEPAVLAHKYVVRTPLSDVVLTSPDGTTTYQLGVDYEVINGDIAYPYDAPNPKPFAVARLAGSAIPDGGDVLASYDYVQPPVHIAYVPLEPQVQDLMGAFLANLTKEFPFPYINTSSCLHEFRPTAEQLASDSRVIKSGRQPIELLVEDTVLQDAAIKRGNPQARLLQWAGNVGDYVKAAGPHLPQDALINIWGYDANWPATYGREAVEYWTKLGHETSVMPWDNLRNVRGWAQVVAEARSKGDPCLGMIGSIWAGRAGGFRETAIVSWRTPRPGEDNYVALPLMEAGQ
jgi:hypothetical protein